GATLFMVLLAAFDVLLARLSGSDDVVVGTQVAGRGREETEGLIGLFVNGLTLRADLSGDPSFREAVARVRRATLDAYAHQDVPFQRLVEELGVERTLSHPPVFNVSFLLQTDGSAPATSPLDLPADTGGSLPDLPVPTGAEYELLVELHEAEGAIVGSAVYSTELFEHDTAARLVAEYGRLLAALLAAPDAPVTAPAPADAAEAERVLAFAAGPAAGDVSLPVHRRFEGWVERAPDAVALRLDEGAVTYRALNVRANRIAHHLRAAGVGPESRVGVSLERSADLVAALLAVLKAGGAYVPLDPRYPADRLRFMVEDAGVDAVVTVDPAFTATWSGAARIVCLACEREAIAARPKENLPVEVAPEGLAYVIYTSGSTGRPKGVAVEHRAVAGLVTGQEYARFGPGEVILQLVPAAFDVSTFEVWGPLANGGTIAVHPAGIPDPERVGDFLTRHGVTTAWLTAGLFHQVVDAGAPGLGGLRRLLAGGEALSPAHVARAQELLPQTVLVDGYGPTETTTFACCHVVRGDEEGAIPVGRPIAGARAYVLDAAMRPVPVGVPGELYLGGGGVARGYVGAPAPTAEKFVPDPWSPGGRLYRTGDRARWNRRGEVEFLGRMDRQVKVRGFRVEPGEVETVLRAHPAVADAVVDVWGEGDARRLAAWVVAAGGAPLTADALRAHAAERLPGHLVPSAFAVIDELPLTHNGKVDRRALPAPELGAGDGFVAPATPTEEIVAGIWADLLAVERVGATDDFFHLGGHSLLATRAVSRLRAVFGVDVPLRDMFAHSTVAGLAAEVDRLRDAAAAGAPTEIDAPEVPDGGEAPVSFAQERMWFLDRLEPGTSSLAIPNALRLRGALDAAALKRALEEVVRRHQSLRTVFPERGGVPVQRVLPPGPFDLPVHDLRGLGETERRGAAAAISRRVAEAPFDLERGPLVRAELARLGDEEHAVFTCVHHAVSDGWSMSLFLTEWTTLYAAFAAGEPSPLPEPALQYPRFAAWQREWLKGEALEAQLGYWRNTLGGASPRLELPTDRPRPEVQGHRGALESLLLPRELSDAVLALGRREGSTLFMVLLAALDLVFQRWSGQDDIVVGTPIAGRTRRETEGVLGLFLNTLALRVDLSGDPTFSGLLARVRDAALGAYAHQDVPFEAVLAEVKPERDLSRSPVFQAMLNVVNFEGARVEVPGLDVEAYGHAEEPASKFDLTLYVGENPQGITANLVYDAALFDAPRMRALLAQLQAVLAQAVDDASRPLSAFALATGDAASVLPDATRPLVTEPWSGAAHEAFAARAAASPGAVAVTDGGETWTYAELDAAANHTARRLMDGGVRPGDVVAVYAHRSPALVRALLATWKAGAAFAVLDPAYPPARLMAQLRAAPPAALLRLSAAGEVPGEVAAALGESVRATVVLGAKTAEETAPSPAPAVTVGPDDLAYVAFTSGTTGVPKAVAGTHRPLAHFFGWYAREFGVSASDRFVLLSGLAHDPLLRDVFAPLTVGGSVAIADAAEFGTPGWLAEWLRAGGVTVAHLTPAMARLLTSSSDEGTTLPALRLACFGGDVLRVDDVRRLRAIAPNVEVVNFYGATETPQAMGAFRVPASLDGLGDRIPVGRGIDGVDLLVLTPSGGVAGIGELGEIAVRTPYLSRGYLNDAELTAARFVANPATGEAADRVYRTGDLGRYRPDGAVETAGRADAQVKVRGFRVEPGEVEA
ncbi:MAG TPA: amino acid adenylation domain-containing protein, partial [Longimicrobium sp.]|nr:amino acid adenylation domain-containing protein [Longimicrobium sp.]